MAEFKLGRIKFVWQGPWTTGTAYVVDDVVNNGGQTYVCVKNHTADSLFATDLNAIPTNWELVSGGTAWRDNWATNTYYNIGDQVKYGGIVYICVTPHTSAATSALGLEADQLKWNAFASSLFWRSNWATSTRYRVNDFVSYGGITYICNTAHTSSSTTTDGLEADQSKWDAFNQGIIYRQDWSGSSVRYRVNDVVKYGASTWICTAAHTSSTTFDNTKWSIFTEGLEFENSWDDATTYQVGDMVTYGGYSYVAKQNHVNKNPVSNPDYWAVYTTGFNFRGDWDDATAYLIGDVVRLGGYTYLAVTDSTGETPPNLTYWNRLNSGTRWADTSQVFTAVSGTTLIGAGIDATFDITRLGTSYSAVVNNGGSGYVNGDTIRILGTSAGGISPANDIVLTVASNTLGEIDTVTTSGNAVTWTEATDYVLGDLVFFGASTYICVQEHTATSLNSPDQDLTATYWNLFSAGYESSVLTTAGDTYYFSPQGPTRLPAGTDGQILRVKGGYPEWAYYGVINNLVYVAPTGTDSSEAGWGLTVDKPWKTIRFACDQINDGYQNKAATSLLEKNKLFLMREVTNWINYTYTTTVTGANSASDRFTALSTANLTANMPVEFSNTHGGVSVGVTYFVKEVINETEFTISNTVGGSVRGLTDSSSSMTVTLAYDETFCERDTGYLINAVIYDLGHGGNAKSTTAAKAYYTAAGNAFINANFGQQTVQTIAAYNYLKTLVERILTNVAPSDNYQAVNGVADKATQVFDTSSLIDETTINTATALLSIVTNGILAGTSSAIPSAVFSNTTISIKTGTFIEVLPVTIPNYTALVGDELRGTVVMPQPAIANLVNDKSKTVSALERINAIVPNLIANNTVVPTTGNTETQQYFFTNYESIVSESVSTNIATMRDVIKTSTTATPAALVDPSNFNVGYFNARRLLLANKDFLIAEVSAWIADQIGASTPPFNGFTYGGAQKDACERDVGYIVDAISYDLTYGGNLETSVAARSYYSKGVFVETGEMAQALAVQAYLKTIIDDIVTASAITKASGNAETQDTSGTAGSAGAATFAQDRIQEIYDTIDTGTEPAAILPSISWISPRIVSAFNTFQTQKAAIATRAIAWINTNYPTLEFDEALCSRDVGYIVDALGYDLAFGGNFRSVKAANAYDRALASTGIVFANQLDATLGVISFIGEELQIATAGTDTVSVNVNVMTDILENGVAAAPAFVYSDPTGYSSEYFNARRLVVANKEFLQAEVSAWIDAQILAGIPPFNGFVYAGANRDKCERDVGYIVDALTYDLTYGGNLATVIAARSYYSNGVLVETGEEAQALALWTYIESIIDDIVTGTALPTFVDGASFDGATDMIIGGDNSTLSPLFLDLYFGGNASAFTANFVLGARFRLEANAKTAVYEVGAITLVNATDVQVNLTKISGDNIVGVDNLNTYTPVFTFLVESTNTVPQVTSGTAGSAGAATFAQARIQEIHDTINTGNSPTTIEPSTLWVSTVKSSINDDLIANTAYIQAAAIDWVHTTYPTFNYDAETCARDVGYIVDALRYDYIFGSNFMSIWNAMSYHRALTSTGVVLSTQLQPTLGIIGFTGASVKEYISGIRGAVGNTLSPSRIEVAANAIYDVLNNGIAGAPVEVITDPANIDTDFVNARTQITNNYAFIKADVSAYINNNYSSVWTALGVTGQAACQRDVGYILDALRYDLTYGGNTQSLIVGSSYYTYINLVIQSTELTATLAAYTHLKSIIDNIVTGSAITPQAGNTTPRSLAGLYGDATAATFAQSRVQDIIDWIDNGVAPATISADISAADPSLVAGFNALQLRKAEIQSDALGYVHKHFQDLSFNEDTCSRDVGYIVDAMCYDMVFGSNFASIIAGKSYHRALSSTQLVLNEQKHASLGLVKFLKYKAKSIAASGAIAKVSTTISDIKNSIFGGAVPRFVWPTFTGADAENFLAAKVIFDNKKFIQAETLAFIEENYPAIDYSKDTCARDVGYIVDAVRYDLTYGGNFATRQAAMAYYSALTDALQIDNADKTATLAAYSNLKTLLEDIANSGLSAYTALQNNVSYISGTSGDSASATLVGTLIQDVIDYIDDPVTNAITETLPSTSWVSSDLVAANSILQSQKTSLRASIISFINTTYPNLVYDDVTCSRDVGLIIDAIGYDLMFGSNFRSVKSGMAYYQAQASKVVGEQKRATLNAFRKLKDLIAVNLTQYSAALLSANDNMTHVINIIDKGVGETPDTVGTMAFMNNVGIFNAAEVLSLNKAFLENESTAWIADQFSGTVTSINGAPVNVITTDAPHNLVVGDPVRFTSPLIQTYITEVNSTGNLVTVRSTAGVIANMKITVTDTSLGNLTAGTYYVKTVVSSTTLTLSSTVNGAAIDPGTETGLVAVTIGGVFGGVSDTVQYYVQTTPSATSFTITSTQGSAVSVNLTSSAGVMTAVYSFNVEACKRDMGAYIDALVYDLKYPGNYKATLAALLYNNAVNGSETSDMFWVSNSSGLRNMTLRGLTGDLTELNDFGTRRPTAGAFVALNPGFGPNDSNVWVTARSHYSQNVTMFGSGCTGAKIDSSLHTGGYKSMVKNDFTTIISDGIGVWCTGADSLTELVSVFNYYGYAGYLAEKGGRIRATNGNSSYGTYGVIAEGVSSKETPIYGNLNNRGAQSQITNTVTDGVSEVLAFEFGNAGTGYTNVAYTINGSGYNADARGDEFRDGAVFETRVIDPNNGADVGGSSYGSAANAAQSGDLTSITIAATDQALSAAYVGMRIQITAGTGVGQYANILTYNTGSKLANVYKDSFDAVTITSTVDSGDYVNISSNSRLYVNMPIYFTGTVIGGVVANQLYYVKALNGTTQFTISTEPAGATVALTSDTGLMTMLAAGWDHIIAGTDIENVLDLTTTYVIEPSVKYTDPGYTATARTLSLSASWKDLTFGDSKYVAIADTGTSTTYSTDGISWATAGALATSASWTDVVYGGGEGATATAIVGGLGGRGAVLEAVLGVPNTTGAATQDQVASVRIIDGGQGYETPPVIEFTPVSGGTGARATCQVLNGKIHSVTVTIPGSGYNSAPTVSVATDRITKIVVNSWGRGYTGSPTITITGGGGTGVEVAAVLVNEGVSQIKLIDENTVQEGSASFLGWSGTGFTSTPTVEIVDSAAKYVAIANGSGDNCYATRDSIETGSAWTAGTSTGKTDLESIAYGLGTYVAVGGTASAVSSTNGTLWLNRTIPTLGAGTYSAVAYGNGTFVAISTGNNVTVSSANGIAWSSAGVLPSTSTWNSIAYGNGRFVAIATGSRSIAISLDKGASWKAVTPGLPQSATWSKIAYGQGLFVAVATGGVVAATSPDGINWTARTLPASASWASVQFGNTNSTPTWVAISSNSTNAATIKTGAKATGRAKVASGIISEIRMTEPGSGYPAGSVVSTTASTDVVTLNSATNLVIGQPIEFIGCADAGLEDEKTYFITDIDGLDVTVSETVGGATKTVESATLSGTYRAGPTVTVTDPSNVDNVALRVRLGDGALGNPSFTNRGADNATATTDVNGDGHSDLFQVSTFVNVYGLSETPTPGANVEFASIPGAYYKLVTVTNYVEDQNNKGTYTATFQINPGLSTLLAPRHGDRITTRIEYSQVRLTGHDYLYVGTGGYERTNYPNVDITLAVQANQELFSGGGRVFFTSTDQDGNFNVGDLFGVQQATGTATLNASAFNLSGLNSLQLGSVELGVGSAIITQFSTDPFFTADSDSIVPTQRAIRAYITAQIGGGQSSLNVNTLTSGVIYIAGNSISTTSGVGINVKSKMNFTGGIDGAPVALGFFLQR